MNDKNNVDAKFKRIKDEYEKERKREKFIGEMIRLGYYTLGFATGAAAAYVAMKSVATDDTEE